MEDSDVTMLTTGGEQDQGRTGEGRGTDPGPTDAQLLARAAAIAEQAARGLLESGWNDDWVRVLQALAILIGHQAGQGDPKPSVSAERLRKKLAEIDPKNAPYWDVDSDSGKRKLANAWKELSNTDCYRQNLTGRAQLARVPGILVPSSEKRGRDNAYWLEVQTVELPALPEAGPVLPVAPPARVPGEITYLEELELPLPILTQLSGFAPDFPDFSPGTRRNLLIFKGGIVRNRPKSAVVQTLPVFIGRAPRIMGWHVSARDDPQEGRQDASVLEHRRKPTARRWPRTAAACAVPGRDQRCAGACVAPLD